MGRHTVLTVPAVSRGSVTRHRRPPPPSLLITREGSDVFGVATFSNPKRIRKVCKTS